VNQIVRKVNECETELIYFHPTHRLKIAYEDGREKMILCSGSAIKYDGLTYRLKESINEIIGY